MSPGLSSVYSSAICHSISGVHVKPYKTFAQKRRKVEPLNTFKRERCVWGICEALSSSPSLPLPPSLSLSLYLSLSIFLSKSSNNYKKEKENILSIVLLLPPAPAARVLEGRWLASLSARSAAAFRFRTVLAPPGGEAARAVVLA